MLYIRYQGKSEIGIVTSFAMNFDVSNLPSVSRTLETKSPRSEQNCTKECSKHQSNSSTRGGMATGTTLVGMQPDLQSREHGEKTWRSD